MASLLARLAAARSRRAASGEAAAVAASGLFDVDWYAAESGETFADAAAAIEHYRTVGAALDASPHPLFEPTAVGTPSAGWTSFGSYLTRPRFADVAPHPAWVDGDGRAALERVGRPADDTSLTISTRGDVGTTRWGDVADGWRMLVAERQHRRRLNVPGGARELPADHVLEVGPTPPADASTLVSIVMPTWNRPESTVRAIASVQAQTWEHWELLVVDDGSTDDTVARVQSVADADPRVKVLARPHQGVCATRNAGLDAATGGYVAFLDSDNTWLPHFLHDMVATMVEQDLPAAYGTLRADGPTGQVWRFAPTSPELIRVKNQVDMNVLVVRADVMHRVGGFDPTLRRAVDYDLAVRIVDLVPLTHLPVIGVIYDHDADRTDRISVSEANMWPHVVRQRYNVDWDAERARERDPDLVGVVLMLGADTAATSAQIEAVGRALQDRRHEIVLVDCAAPRHAVTRHAPLVALDPSVRVVGYPRPMSWAFAADLGAAATRAARLLVVDHGVLVQPDALRSLVAALDDADLAVPGPAVEAQAFAVRAETFFAVGGLDAMMHQMLEVADLAARLQSVGRSTTTVPGEVEVRTAKTSVYADQVLAEFTRRHGTHRT